MLNSRFLKIHLRRLKLVENKCVKTSLCFFQTRTRINQQAANFESEIGRLEGTIGEARKAAVALRDQRMEKANAVKKYKDSNDPDARKAASDTILGGRTFSL